MPGHPLSHSTEATVREAYHKLEELISSHDIIFLLMDSRESRWLPTVLAAAQPVSILMAARPG